MAGGRAQHAIGLALAREYRAQPVEDLGGREVEAPPVGALLLGEGDQRMARALGFAEARIVKPLAQAEGGEHHVARLERRQQPVERQAGERQGVDAPARHARHLLQRLGALHGDQAGHRARLLGRDVVVMDDVQRIARLLHVQPGERTPGAAHGIEGLAGLLAQPAHVLDGVDDGLLGIALARRHQPSGPTGSVLELPSLPCPTATSSRLPPPRSPITPDASGMPQITP